MKAQKSEMGLMQSINIYYTIIKIHAGQQPGLIKLMQLAADESQTHTKKNTANKYCSHKRWYKNAHGPHKKYIIDKITNKRQNYLVNRLPLAGLPPSLPISPRYGWQMFIALVGCIQIDNSIQLTNSVRGKTVAGRTDDGNPVIKNHNRHQSWCHLLHKNPSVSIDMIRWIKRLTKMDNLHVWASLDKQDLKLQYQCVYMWMTRSGAHSPT